MSKEEILLELHKIGFSHFVHLNKEKRDGRIRWTWTYPVDNKKDWFTVLLVEQEGKISIEKLINPLGRPFNSDEIEELLIYIRSEIWTH